MTKWKFLDRYLPAIPVLAVLLPMFFSHSCANTTQAPSGGLKDSIPPVILKVSPAQGSLNVPTHGARFSFTFDEYVKVKEIKNIFLSPPLPKPAKYKMKGKTLNVYFENDLDSNTTYTLSFTDAVTDNNEGNMFPGFTYVFSTGDHIDSLMITGIVQDCNTLMPVKGATVLLYTDLADSAVFLKRPYAAVKTDEWGYFCLRNIKDTLYRLYAIKDENNNNLYNPESETIAFVDSLIRPLTVVNDTLPEVQAYDMKDTLSCIARKTEYELNLFKERPTKQLIVNHVRLTDRSSYITFMAPNTHIDTMWMKGIPSNRLITQFNIRRDSLEIWVNDKRRMPDTLHLFVNYRKTDTSGRLSPFTEQVKLYFEGDAAKSKTKKKIEKADTTCQLKLTVEPTTVEQYGFSLDFDYPIIYESFDSVKFWALNPKQQRINGKFTVEQDSLNIRHFSLKPSETLLQGYEYYMKIPHRGFRDINGFYNDSTEVKVTLPTDEKLSKLNLDLVGVDNKYIVDLLDETRTRVIRSYIVDSDKTLQFPYLASGKYSIRITQDINRNSIVDTGSVLDNRQPEKVKFYKLDGNAFITIKEGMEISQKLSLKDMFK